MSYIGKEPADSFISFAKQDFSTSATTSYTLVNAVANENELALFINFVRQEPTTAYTASGTTLTLTSATASTDDMYCVYLGQAKQTVNAPDGSVGASQLASDAVTSAKANFFNADTSAADLGTGLHIKTGDSGVSSLSVSHDELIVESNGNVGISILGGTSSTMGVAFGDSGDSDIGRINYVHSDNSMRFINNASENVRIDSSGDLQFNSGFGSLKTAFGVRAWVVFDGNNGSITNSGNAEGNVSSVTRHGTGNYTVNFTNAMPDTEYTVTGSTVGNNYGTRETFLTGDGGLKATSSINVQVHDRGSSFVDNNRVNVNVVR